MKPTIFDSETFRLGLMFQHFVLFNKSLELEIDKIVQKNINESNKNYLDANLIKCLILS